MYIKLIGAVMLTVCGGCIGAYLSSVCKARTEKLLRVSEMLFRLSLMLDFESPTVDAMIMRLSSSEEMPLFLRGACGRSDVISALSDNADGMEKRDAERLTRFFTELGSADKPSERQRIAEARAYFDRRAETERPKNEQSAKLAGSLGLLGGLFAAVIMI